MDFAVGVVRRSTPEDQPEDVKPRRGEDTDFHPKKREIESAVRARLLMV